MLSDETYYDMTIKYNLGNGELLRRHGHLMYNEFRTIQQVWDKLGETPNHPSKSPKYRELRELMLDMEEE